jgi:hypothetical protein
LKRIRNWSRTPFNNVRAGTCEMEISIVVSEKPKDSHQMKVEGGLQDQLV